ncbi:hypothetical protein JHK85_038241 [Glycine max]|nr:hypothetical protein JHK85_038241 [Glycine max]
MSNVVMKLKKESSDLTSLKDSSSERVLPLTKRDIREHQSKWDNVLQQDYRQSAA